MHVTAVQVADAGQKATCLESRARWQIEDLNEGLLYLDTVATAFTDKTSGEPAVELVVDIGADTEFGLAQRETGNPRFALRPREGLVTAVHHQPEAGLKALAVWSGAVTGAAAASLACYAAAAAHLARCSACARRLSNCWMRAA